MADQPKKFFFDIGGKAIVWVLGEDQPERIFGKITAATGTGQGFLRIESEPSGFIYDKNKRPYYPKEGQKYIRIVPLDHVICIENVLEPGEPVKMVEKEEE